MILILNLICGIFKCLGELMAVISPVVLEVLVVEVVVEHPPLIWVLQVAVAPARVVEGPRVPEGPRVVGAGPRVRNRLTLTRSEIAHYPKLRMNFLRM